MTSKFSLLFLLVLLSTKVLASNPGLIPNYDDEDYLFEEKHLDDGPLRPMEAPFNAVTGKYGKLVVKLGKFTAEAIKKPWSSWWYPLWETDVFETTNNVKSTLQRYDEISKKYTRKRSYAANYQRVNIYNERASDWEGLCDAWALASIMEKEPKRAIKKGGISFRIRDLKLLLLKTYELNHNMPFYGQRHNAEYDSEYEDIYPEEFHKFFQEELFRKRNAFIMDYEASVQVWNVPVFKIKTIVKKDETRSNVVKVKTYLYYASPFVDDKDYVGIEEVIKTYKYEFTGHWKGDEFEVDFGLWKESSRWDHPDYVMAKPDKVNRGSFNKSINYKIVDKILKGSR